jgi:hypothetical protein
MAYHGQMPDQTIEKITGKPKRSKTLQPYPSDKPVRRANGQFEKGHPGWPGVDAGRARRALNADTIREMHEAFRVHGKKVIERVIKHQPAMFLKMLVLLVPRDIEVTHKGGVKAMSDEQIERAIEAIEDMLAKRDSGDRAKVVEHRDVVGGFVGKDAETPESPMISKGDGG